MNYTAATNDIISLINTLSKLKNDGSQKRDIQTLVAVIFKPDPFLEILNTLRINGMKKEDIESIINIVYGNDMIIEEGKSSIKETTPNDKINIENKVK